MKGDPLTLKRKCLWIQLLSYKVLVIHLEKNELLPQHKGLKITIYSNLYLYVIHNQFSFECTLRVS